MKKSLFLLLLFVCTVATAQVMPSPDASSMIKGISTPVNLYNGVVSFNVPLYEATANNGASVPVRLQYNTGGIKVHEVAGVAGLGWHLQAGGAITRIVRGEPDDQAKFADGLTYENFKKKIDNDTPYLDYEKDLFYFSFPGGSGRFIFSASFMDWLTENASTTNSSVTYDSFVKLPSSDVKIQFHYTNSLESYWIITDTQGTKYYFGQTDHAREKTTTNYKNNKETENYESKNERTFLSSWHLTKIEYANQPAGKGISFSYDQQSTITDEKIDITIPLDENNPYYECISDCSSDDVCSSFCNQFKSRTEIHQDTIKRTTYIAGNTVATYKSTITTKYLTSLQFPKGKITLDYGNRGDLTNGKRLYSIKLYDHHQQLVSNTLLNQSYFNADNSYYKGDKNGPCRNVKCLRLKLNTVTKDGLPIYSFDYSDNKDIQSNGVDKFLLPPRDSYYTDHWGYYNGGSHQGSMYVWYEKNNSSAIRGMDKSPQKSSQANMLTKVIFPTGGYRLFKYGQHANHGGVRIDTIANYNQDGALISGTSYAYYEENASPTPSYIESIVVPKTTFNPIHVPPFGSLKIKGVSNPHIFQTSPTLTFDLNGTTDGYERVVETDITSNRKIEHYYLGDSKGKTTTPAIKYMYSIDLINESSDREDVSLNRHGFPYVTTNLDFYDRGLEWKTITYDEQGNKVNSIERFYEHETTTNFSVSNYSMHLNFFDGEFMNALEPYDSDQLRFTRIYKGNNYKYIVSKYRISSKTINLVRSKSIVYDDAGNHPVSQTETQYDYHGEYKTLPTVVSTDTRYGSNLSVSNKSQKLLYYPSDGAAIRSFYEDQHELAQLINKHIIGMPIATLQKVETPDDGFTGYWTAAANYTKFTEQNGLVLPKSIHSYTIGYPEDDWYNEFDTEVQTLTYNNQGLLESSAGKDHILTSHTYDEAGYITSTTVNPGVDSLTTTTSYDYYPLIGLKQVIAPNGQKTSYEYDHRNQLLLVRDHDGNIVKRYRQNYTSGETGMESTIHIEGNRRQGETLTFSPSIIKEGYGKQTTYHWEIDGKSFERDSVSYVFKKSGNKLIKLTMTNPEEQPYEVEKWAWVSPVPLEANIVIPTNCPISGKNISLSLSGLRSGYEPHLTTYEWNIDGRIVTGRTSVDHTFTSAGIKNITLTMRNPNYDTPFVTSSSIEIYGSTVQQTYRSFDYPQSEKSISVAPLPYSINYNGNGWFEVFDKQDNHFKIRCFTNSTTNTRNGTITVNFHNCESKVIRVTQYGVPSGGGGGNGGGGNGGGGSGGSSCGSCHAPCYCYNGQCVCQ